MAHEGRREHRSDSAQALVLVIALALVGSSAGHFLKLTRSQYTQLRSSGNYNTWTSSPSPTASPLLKSIVKIVFIPSFQGTLLRNNESALPLFLAPLSRTSYKRVYDLLRSEDTHAVTGEDAVEYAHYGCKNHTGHFSHCLTVPLRGAVSQLRAKYQVESLGYDWRQTRQTIYNGEFGEKVRHALKCEKCVIVAHGSGCNLLRYAAAKQTGIRSTTACIAPITTSIASATAQGDGLTTAGNAHMISDCMKSVRERKIELGSMAGELGMLRGRKGRSALPEVKGLDYDVIVMVAKQKRASLVRSFDATRELANNDGTVLDVCVEGLGEVMMVNDIEMDGDGVVEKGGCNGVANQVLSIQAKHLDLVRMVDAAVTERCRNQ